MIYLNGQFIPKTEATINVDEWGMLYAYGVYEVLRYYAGKPLGMDLHLQRMCQSLERIRIAQPDDFDRFPEIAQELLAKNNQTDARIYWQITLGVAPRKPRISEGMIPTVLITSNSMAALDMDEQVVTKSAVFAPDERWSNCWIKSLMLLPNVLAANKAFDAGYDAAILHRGDVVTEATNANVMIVKDGQLITHPADRFILNGVTRQLVLKLARKLEIPVREEHYSPDQLFSADEVILTGTTVHVAAITHVDDKVISDGKVGPVTQRLHDAFIQFISDECLSKQTV